MRKIFILLILISTWLASAAQEASHTFSFGKQDFLLNGKAIQLISGELHYQRIPAEYWQHRLRLAHAMGLNAVSVYCFWNDHEPRPGEFDFTTGSRNLAAFIRMAQAEGLWVILRPGPYVCAEWEFGGYPWWLLKEKDMVVRSRDPRFMAACGRYIAELGKQVRDLQVTRGGPVILLQVENEYGSYGKDKLYMAEVRDMYEKAGFDIPMFTADGAWQCRDGYLPGLLPALNGEYNFTALRDTVDKYNNGCGPYFVPEFYPGWLDHWGEPKSLVTTESLIPDVENLLAAGASLNFYMLHGGTNFGYMNGANYSKEFPIQPDLTSYDYDAPISEAGCPTPKYFAFKKLISNYLPDDAMIPGVPENNPVIEIPAVKLDKSALLFDNLGKPAFSEKILSMEELDQGYGLINYRTTIEKIGTYTLKIDELRDYAQVYLNGMLAGIAERRLNQDSLVIKVTQPHSQLDILVENLGRINYGKRMTDNRKGITKRVLLNGSEISGWQIYNLPLDNPGSFRYAAAGKFTAPALRKGSFDLKETGDTFLDMSQAGKGFVWVNGHNLGRYWHMGPQQTLYCPAPFLKKGNNEIVVLDLLNFPFVGISGLKEPILNTLKQQNLMK